MITNNFISRQNGPRKEELGKMLEKIGASSLDELIDETIPSSIRLKKPLNLPAGMNEYEYLNHIKEIGAKNKVFKSYIGLGYYNTITPGVLIRNVLENPGWYTSYTPYQAEISQGRLEALLNYQTVVCDLTGMEISNCSLLDESTAAAEVMYMLYNTRPRATVKRGANIFFVSNELLPQNIELLKTRSAPLGIELIFGDHNTYEFNDDKVFGAIIQYPTQKGNVLDYSDFVKRAHANETLVAVAADLMSLAVLTPPKEWDADVVVGSTQRFGTPMGYGGPHSGYLATKDSYKRNMPGRIIGVSIDANGNKALRMALCTREQHIKREKATSNICTAQALLATMVGFYAAYHGQEGIKAIAKDINNLAGILSDEVKKLGYEQLNKYFFDTVEIKLPGSVQQSNIEKLALDNQMNFRYIDDKTIGISTDETTSLSDINTILKIFASANNKEFTDISKVKEVNTIPDNLTRKSEFLTHPVFNKYHSETEMMRYMKKLENKDIALNRSMTPLGSCTMKLTPATSMFHLSWPEFGSIHPFVPTDQAEGYTILIKELEKILCEVTGFKAISFQPNSGAAGEYTGLMIIREYHRSRGDTNRNIILIPDSAHGTNPASTIMAGGELVLVKCDEKGNIDVNNLREKATEHKDKLSTFMITYPSTHGVFEDDVLEMMDIIHENGGLVYMDGANMNAQVGLTNPGFIGADVCHLNLHKTFSSPHGGGGPGAGPVGVAEHLVEFLPSHPIVKTGGEKGITAIAGAPYGSASLLPVTYCYVKMLGGEGLTEATRYAILNANYLESSLKEHYPTLFTGSKGRVAHEYILDCNHISNITGIGAGDIAKRLMDYGMHAPTVAFPVHGTFMIEPTESEPLSELDRFIGAMISIKKEIQEIIDGKADKEVNVIKKSPHTLGMIMNENWDLPYSKKEAAFPMPWSMEDKYWPPVTHVDDAYGDRNLQAKVEVSDNQ